MKWPQCPMNTVSERTLSSSPSLQRNRRQSRKSLLGTSSSAVVAASAVLAAVATLVANLSSFAEGFSTSVVPVSGTRSSFSQARRDCQPVCAPAAAGEVARLTSTTTKRHATATTATASGSCYPRSTSTAGSSPCYLGTRRIDLDSRNNKRSPSSSSMMVRMAHGSPPTASSSSTVQCAPTTSMSDVGGGSSVDGIGDTRHDRRRRSCSSHASGSGGGPTAELLPGDPIEFWHAKALVLGSYESPVPGRRSLAVRTEAGEALVIDAGQIVGIWLKGEMRGPLPSGAEEWGRVRGEAAALLQGMPTRSLDLGPFWRAASSRGKDFLVTAAHAAEFLFAEDRAKLGLKKRRPFQFRGCVALRCVVCCNSLRHEKHVSLSLIIHATTHKRYIIVVRAIEPMICSAAVVLCGASSRTAVLAWPL